MAKIKLGGTVCDTNGSMPENGSQLHDYNFTRNNLTDFSLHELKGKKVILNIFPSVDTAVCAASVRTFNKEAAGLSNTVVVCISKDLPFAQARFCGAEGIENVITVSDFKDSTFARDMGLEIVDGAFSGLDARSIIVLDEDMKVSYTQLVEEIADEPDYAAAIAAAAD